MVRICLAIKTFSWVEESRGFCEVHYRAETDSWNRHCHALDLRHRWDWQRLYKLQPSRPRSIPRLRLSMDSDSGYRRQSHPLSALGHQPPPYLGLYPLHPNRNSGRCLELHHSRCAFQCPHLLPVLQGPGGGSVRSRRHNLGMDAATRLCNSPRYGALESAQRSRPFIASRVDWSDMGHLWRGRHRLASPPLLKPFP